MDHHHTSEILLMETLNDWVKDLSKLYEFLHVGALGMKTMLHNWITRRIFKLYYFLHVEALGTKTMIHYWIAIRWTNNK